MAPFKLKFRMGSSRSTSQETDTETSGGTGVQQPLLLNNSGAVITQIGDSNTTIDSEYNSLGSINTNDQRNLLPSNHSSLDERSGKLIFFLLVLM